MTVLKCPGHHAVAEHLATFLANRQVQGRPVQFLEELPDGRLLYHLKRSWRDGTDSVVFEPLEFLERLAALVPAPRFNMIRYSGVLAPAAAWRARLAPRRQQPVTTPTSSCPAVIANMLALSPSGLDNLPMPPEPALPMPGKHRPKQYAWADLLKRVFAVDALKCEHCGGRMRILCAVNPPEAIRKILDCLGMPIRAPPTAPALIEEWGDDGNLTPAYSDAYA